MALPTQKRGNRQKSRATSLRRRRRRTAGMPVRLGLTPKNPKHREPSRVDRHAASLYPHHPKHSPPTPKVYPPSPAPEFPLHKKSRGRQLLNRMEANMSSRERRELDNRMKTLRLKKDLGLANVKTM